MDDIRKEITANKVVVYMKGTPSFPQCGFSAQTVGILEELGYPYASVDILADQGKREAIKQFSNWPTIPQVYINGKFVGCCDIVTELYQSGELKQLLDAAHADAPAEA
jgi:monothiol glutaredoxin